jgi:Peptidase propeptide and YPEB domain
MCTVDKHGHRRSIRMKVNRKVLAIGAAIAALAAGGVGIAYAVGGGDSEEQVTGPDAEKAKAAALEAVGGGTVTEAEYQESGGDGVYEVEVQRPDGSEVEVHIGGDFNPVGTAPDDDSGGEDEGADDDDGAGDDD